MTDKKVEKINTAGYAHDGFRSVLEEGFKSTPTTSTAKPPSTGTSVKPPPKK